MGPIKLDKQITGAMKTWGGNFDSNVGCSHNSEADTTTSKITSKKVTLNTEMDPNMAKPKSMNPGVDKAFWGKAEPQSDTTGHGKLTKESHDRM